MKCQVSLCLLLLLLAYASGQFRQRQNRRLGQQSSLGRGQQQGRSFGRQTQTSSRGRLNQAGSFGGRGRAGTRGQQQPNRNLLQQSTAVNFNCPEREGNFGDPSQCDKYYTCKDGVPKENLCLDGLYFNEKLPVNSTFPCSYPVEVECGARTRLQDANPTEECPRQYAIFRTSQDPVGCGEYTNCVAGRSYQFRCPETLAFNENTLRCEWADESPSCDAPAYLGFQCPAVEFTEAQIGEFTREASPDDCKKYYICLNKEDGTRQPRLQSCDYGTVFNAESGICDENIEEVAGCAGAYSSEELAAFRSRKEAETSRRESRLLELRKKIAG